MLGISRRIDQLGRIVIPIEIRKKLKLEEGSLIDINISNDSLVLTKNEPLKDFKKYIIDICDNVKDCIFFVIGEKSVIYASGSYKKHENREVDDAFLDFCKSSHGLTSYINIFEDNIKDKYAYCYPLKTFGDVHGFACFLFNNEATLENKGMMNFVCDYIASKL